MEKTTSLIKKLRLKKGCKYILFFSKSTGMHPEDLARIPSIPELCDISFLVEDVSGIKVLEYDGKISDVLELREKKSYKS